MLHFFCSLRRVQLHPSFFLCSRAEQDTAQPIRDGTYWANCSFSLLSWQGEKSWSLRPVLGESWQRQARGKNLLERTWSPRLWNLHLGGIWEQVVAAEILIMSRGTGSSRLASVPPELPCFLQDWAGWNHCYSREWERTTPSIPAESQWWNTLPRPLHLISTLLVWNLIKQ